VRVAASAAGTTPSAKVLSHPAQGPFNRESSGVVRMPSVVDYGAFNRESSASWSGIALRLQAVEREDSSPPSPTPSIIEVGVPALRMNGREAFKDAPVPAGRRAEVEPELEGMSETETTSEQDAEGEQLTQGRRRKLDCSCC